MLHVPAHLAASRRPIALLLSKVARAGGPAARLEQSKLGWTISRWVEALEGDDPWARYRCAAIVLTDAGVTRSCGMHAFGLPDAQVQGDARAANVLIGALNVYQFAEQPLLVSGDTFAPDAETPRRRLRGNAEVLIGRGPPLAAGWRECHRPPPGFHSAFLLSTKGHQHAEVHEVR